MIDAFLYGAILALGLIIPLGVQNIFIFNQGGTQKHFLDALPSAITAIICDGILILLAVLGVSLVVLTIPLLKVLIFIAGFLFLMGMGWITWNTHPKKINEGHKPLSAKRQIQFAASVSILNPHALIDTIGVIGTNSLNFDGHEKWAFTIACILVSVFWFLGLTIAGHFLHKIDKTGFWMHGMNKCSAIVIWIVGLNIGYQAFEILKSLTFPG